MISKQLRKEDRFTDSRLEINKDSTRNIMFVVCLVEKHVFAIASFGRPFLQDALLVYAVFRAQTLPVYGPHFMVGSVRRFIPPRTLTKAHFGCRIVQVGLLQSLEALYLVDNFVKTRNYQSVVNFS
jgi:hypothetical protein